MKIEEILDVKLSEFERRLRSVQIGESVAISLCFGLSVYLAFFVINKFIVLPLNWPAFFLAICGLSSSIGLFVGRHRRISPFSIACQVDERLGLEERVSTAWEYKDQGRTNELVPLLIRDAVRHLQGVKAKRVFPHRWLKRGKYAIYLFLSIVLVSFSSYLLPFPFRGVGPSVALQEEGHSLMRYTERLMKKERPEQLRRASSLAKEMRELAEDMYYKKLEEEKALQSYSSLEKKISQALEVAQGELLKELKALTGKEGGQAIDEERLSQLKEALQKEQYKSVRELLEKTSTGEGDKNEELLSYAKDLEALNTMKQAIRESRQRLKDISSESGDEERMARVSGQEKEDLAFRGDRETRGYGSAEDEDFLLELELAKGYSSFPGRSSSRRIQEERVLEFDEEGRLVKVKGQFDQGYFLMSLLRNLSPSLDKSGSATEEALISYGKLMMNKLTGEKIPLSYKEQVKRYFSSLESE